MATDFVTLLQERFARFVIFPPVVAAVGIARASVLDQQDFLVSRPWGMGAKPFVTILRRLIMNVMASLVMILLKFTRDTLRKLGCQPSCRVNATCLAPLPFPMLVRPYA